MEFERWIYRYAPTVLVRLLVLIHPLSRIVESGSSIHVVALRANDLVNASGASVRHGYITLPSLKNGTLCLFQSWAVHLPILVRVGKMELEFV
jgi:hypothetical protein